MVPIAIDNTNSLSRRTVKFVNSGGKDCGGVGLITVPAGVHSDADDDEDEDEVETQDMPGDRAPSPSILERNGLWTGEDDAECDALDALDGDDPMDADAPTEVLAGPYRRNDKYVHPFAIYSREGVGNVALLQPHVYVKFLIRNQTCALRLHGCKTPAGEKLEPVSKHTQIERTIPWLMYNPEIEGHLLRCCPNCNKTKGIGGCVHLHQRLLEVQTAQDAARAPLHARVLYT
jgi:hypothetical protein